MATYIKTLKEDNGDITYPQTKAGAVLLNNGSDLETELSQYVTAEDIASTAAVDYSEILSRIYPVGSIYMSATLSTAAQVNATLGGTWEAWGSGRVPVGGDTSQTEFETVGKTGGEKTHKLTVDEMPNHYHDVVYGKNDDTTCVTISCTGTGNKVLNLNGWAWDKNSNNPYGNNVYARKTGGGKAHNNLQPYITCYMYKRIS